MSDIDWTDLVCKARRTTLSDGERRQLVHLTRTNAETRLFGMMLQQLDRSSQVQRGDDALIARMTAHALRAAERTPGRRLRPHGWLVAAAVMLAATMAGAFWAVSHPAALSTGGLERPDPTVTSQHPLRRAAMASRMAHAEPSSTAPAPSASEPVLQVASRRAEESHRAPESGDSDPAGASALFARANLLRRIGRGSEALPLYETVVARYPSAREALPSRLALGKLLEPSQPARALAHYQALAAGSTVLRAEALWGVAQTARRLGKQEAERRALTELVGQFPNSAYADAARGRLSHAVP